MKLLKKLYQNSKFFVDCSINLRKFNCKLVVVISHTKSLTLPVCVTQWCRI